jgi:biopolymer transport protein TolQ
MPEASHSLSVVHLILNASFLVQLVMVILCLASVISWVMVFQREFYQRKAIKAVAIFEKQFWSGIDLNQLYRQGNARGDSIEGIENIFRAGFKEFTRLRQQASGDPDAVMEGSMRAMRVALAREQEKLEENLPFLASVASVSPYIGLFGTVWGIMVSFLNIANAGQPSLATVAPGIAEALIATAMGLFAAIPAVLAYNKFSARAENLMSNYQTFAEEFSAILHRQVHSN